MEAQLEPWVRLAMAWEATGLVDDERDVLLSEWASHLGHEAATTVGGDVWVRQGRVRCWADGPTDAVIPPMAEFLGSVGSEPQAMSRLMEVGAELEPIAIGCWVESRGGGANAGWYLPAPMSGARLRNLVAPGFEPFLDLGTVLRWSGAVGAGTPHDTLEVDLGSDVEAAVHAASGAFAAAGAARPSDESLAILMDAGERGGGLGAEIWINEGGGVVATGINARQPSTGSLIELLRTLVADADPDLLARFSGALGVDDPEHVGVATWAHGPDVVARYRVA